MQVGWAACPKLAILSYLPASANGDVCGFSVKHLEVILLWQIGLIGDVEV